MRKGPPSEAAVALAILGLLSHAVVILVVVFTDYRNYPAVILWYLLLTICALAARKRGRQVEAVKSGEANV